MAIISNADIIELLDDRGRIERDRMDLYSVLSRINEDVDKAAQVAAITAGKDPDTYRAQNNKYYTKDQITFVVYDDVFKRPGFDYDGTIVEYDLARTVGTVITVQL